MDSFDVVVVGAGAAGLLATLAARGVIGSGGVAAQPEPDAPSVLLLDGQDRPGKKILISGGGRCNVTNRSVTSEDFRSRSPRIVRSVLAEFPVEAVRTFFSSRGIDLVEEPMGKLFPRTGRARAVLDGLLSAAERSGAACRFGRSVDTIERATEDSSRTGWIIDDAFTARRVVVATGGLSVPSTGCTGIGYRVAQAAGHRLVERFPALAPLTVTSPPDLAGITTPAILTVEDADGGDPYRAAGSVLFTHRGLSGPAALDVSGEVERRMADGQGCRVRADLWTLLDPEGPFKDHLGLSKLPGACLPEAPRTDAVADVERFLMEAARAGGGGTVGRALASRLPRRVVQALVPGAEAPLATLSREARRRVAEAVARLDLGVSGTEGYRKAEVTLGGVPLAELRRRTLESRLAPGLHFCGEVCDATGRLGGFNFQWAWSSGFVAGRGAGARNEPVT